MRHYILFAYITCNRAQSNANAVTWGPKCCLKILQFKINVLVLLPNVKWVCVKNWSLWQTECYSTQVTSFLYEDIPIYIFLVLYVFIYEWLILWNWETVIPVSCIVPKTWADYCCHHNKNIFFFVFPRSNDSYAMSLDCSPPPASGTFTSQRSLAVLQCAPSHASCLGYCGVWWTATLEL